MENILRQELCAWIAQCDDKDLLQEVKALMEDKGKDWWDELSEEEQNLVRESEAEYERGEFITFEELMKQFEEESKKKGFFGRR